MKKLFLAISRFSWSYLLGAALLFASGLLFLLFPAESASWVSRVLGALTLLFFVLLTVRLFARRERGVGFFLLLVAYLLAILAGGAMIFSPETTLEYLSIAVGLYTIMTGSFKLSLAASSRRYRLFGWWLLVGLATLSITLGLWMLRFPFIPFAEHVTENAVLLGACLTLCGVEELFAFFYQSLVDRSLRREMTATTVVINGEAARRQAAEEREAARRQTVSAPAEGMPDRTSGTAPEDEGQA